MAKISVIIPVYNTAQYLTQCLESVLAQTFTDFEVIAVDDGSQDNSWEILKKFSGRDARLKIYRNEQNRGVSYTLNRAISYCTTPIIARMDSDDLMVRERIAKQYHYLQQHPECIALGGQVSYINNSEEIVGSSCFPLTDVKIKANFFSFQAIADPTVIFNLQNLSRELFYFDENLVVAEGLDLYFRLFKAGSFANLPDTLVLFRQREGSLTKDLRRTFRAITAVRTRAIKEYGIVAPWSARGINLLQQMITSCLPFDLVVKLHDLYKKTLVKI